MMFGSKAGFLGSTRYRKKATFEFQKSKMVADGQKWP